MKMITLVAIAALSIASFNAAANTDLGPGVVNAAEPPYSADPNGGNCGLSDPDSTAAIQAAIDAVWYMGGGIVFLPTGRYCVKSNLVVKPATVLKGVFVAPGGTHFPYTPPIPATDGQPKGTVLLAVASQNNYSGLPFIRLSGTNAGVDGLSIIYPNQRNPEVDPWTPVAYPPTIFASEPDISVQNVLLVNSYHGIKFEGNTGRHYVRAVYGQPIWIGISVNGPKDVSRILDVHFWPFWANKDPVKNWIRANGYSFIFSRSDWQVAQDLFSYGYHVGIHFNDTGTGGTNGQFTNIAFDSAHYGIYLTKTQPYGIQVTNLNVVGKLPDSVGVYGQVGGPSTISIQNASFWGIFDTTVAWLAPGSIMISGARFQSATPGRAIIYVNDGSAMIQGNSFESSPNSGLGISVGALAGKVMITGNMMLGKTISVSNGANTLQANNQP